VRFRIWAPPYKNSSGGIRALHILCAELRARGHKAGMVPLWHRDGVPLRPRMRREYGGRVPLDASLDMAPSDAGTVNVLPEVLRGNPAAAGVTARFLGNRQMFPHDADDLVFVWDPSFDLSAHRLRVPIVETDLFHPRTGPRSGVAYWTGKGSSSNANITRTRQPERLVPRAATRITYTWPTSRADLAELLGSVDHLVCFDEWTAVAFEATLCGTPVLLRGNPSRMRASLEGGHGVSPDLDEARATVHLAWERYQNVVLPEIAGDVDRFVEVTAAALAERAAVA
jgi:hypothetical protein